jgi:hypothetical protein
VEVVAPGLVLTAVTYPGVLKFAVRVIGIRAGSDRQAAGLHKVRPAGEARCDSGTDTRVKHARPETVTSAGNADALVNHPGGQLASCG